MADIHVVQPEELGTDFEFNTTTKKWGIAPNVRVHIGTDSGTDVGGFEMQVIDYNPADHVTVDSVPVENASVAVGWSGTELSVNGTPDTVMVNSGTADPAKEVEYVAIKIPLPTTGSFEVDLSQLNGSMMQIHTSGAEQTLEQLIANYPLTSNNPYDFTAITATHVNLGLVYKHTDFGNSTESGSLTSTRMKVEILTYLEFLVMMGEDLSNATPEEIAEFELTYAHIRILVISDADTGANILNAPIYTAYPYIYFALTGDYVNSSETPVTTLNPNAKLLINFDGIGEVSYELPENAEDGDYLKVLGDVKLLGTDLVSGDYFQLYDGKSKGIPYRQDEFYSNLLNSVVIPPVTTEVVIPLIDLGVVGTRPSYGKDGQRVIHRYYDSYSGQHRFKTYYWYDSQGWVSDFAIKSSDDVEEGLLNRYLTTERFDSNINDRWKTTGIQYGNDKFPTSSTVHGYVNYALSSKVDISEYDQTKNLAQANQLNLTTKAEQADLDAANATVAEHTQTLLNKADIAALTTLAQLVDTKADQAYVVSEIARITGNAPAALDTLAEIAEQLGNDQTQINNLLDQIGNRVRFDAAQALTATQQDQARANINAEKAGEAASLVSAVTPASIGAATAAQGDKADTALQSGDVAPVALSGSFSDLINKPVNATTTVDGFMSATDKTKLDGLSTGGGLTNIKEIQNLTTTYQKYVGLKVDPALTATDVGINLATKGTGAFILGNSPDTTVPNGNARGQYAIDMQLYRTDITQVASGNYSVAIGSLSTAAAQYSIALGYMARSLGGIAIGQNSYSSSTNNIAIGVDTYGYGSGSIVIGYSAGTTGNVSEAIAIGFNSDCSSSGVAVGARAYASGYCVAIGPNASTLNTSEAVAIGRYSRSESDRSVVIGKEATDKDITSWVRSLGSISTTGDWRDVLYMPYATTTTATTTGLTTDGLAVTYENVFGFNAKGLFVVNGHILAKTTAGVVAVWEVSCIVKVLDTYNSASFVGTPSVTKIAEDVGSEAWTVSLTIDQSTQLVPRVTGVAGVTIRWGANLTIKDLTY